MSCAAFFAVAVAWYWRRDFGLTAPIDQTLTPTPLAALLFANGLPDSEASLVEPHKNHKGLWRIKFCYEDSEPLSMDIEQASTLAVDLHQMSEDSLADEIADAVRRAERYRRM